MQIERNKVRGFGSRPGLSVGTLKNWMYLLRQTWRETCTISLKALSPWQDCAVHILATRKYQEKLLNGQNRSGKTP